MQNLRRYFGIVCLLIAENCTSSQVSDPRPPPPGALGATCLTGTDCDSGYCVVAGTSSLCSQLCSEDCPAGYACRVVVVAAAVDPVALCWPEASPLCTPVVETCNGTDDDCDGLADEDFLNADGLYAQDLHCGACAVDCATTIPHGTGVCESSSGYPHCVVSTCEAGYLPLSPFACALPPDLSCKPCVTDEDCSGGRCTTIDRGSFCSGPCGDVGPTCGDGYTCQTLVAGGQGCLPVSGSCVCGDLTDGQSRGCAVTNAFGLCPGAQTCSAATGWSPCSAATPAEEVCNGLDEDCDGSVDDGVLAPADPCESTNASGTCVGAWVCDGTHEWKCEASTPEDETCNGHDDNCDGQVDETFRDPTSGAYVNDENCGACGASCAGLIPNGTSVCAILGSAARCVVASCDPGYRSLGDVWCSPIAETLCEPCADDFDCGGANDRCLTLDGEGVCGRNCGLGNDYGTPEDECPTGFTCQDLGGGDKQCVPLSNSCQCLAVDDSVQRLCTTTNGFGTCSGLSTCLPATGWSSCSAPTPAAEICNGQDDDCNSSIDESLTGALCPDQDGACAGSRQLCAGTAGWQPCTAATYVAFNASYETTETTCDGLNNDCDASTDEMVGPLCAKQNGVCAGSTQTCGGGSGWLACTDARYLAFNASYEPTETTCDGLDNDCDGSIDEGLTGTLCPNQNGVCAGSRQTCAGTAGWLTCSASTYVAFNANYETTETLCDGLNNDCDGSTDEMTGPLCPLQNGVCAGARQNCGGVSGWQTCTTAVYTAHNGSYQATTESSCDGLDNDCDGSIDEALTGALCPLQGGVCAGSRQTCAGTAGWLTCSAATYVAFNASYETTETRCDGLNNDCDGSVDEALTGALCPNQNGVCAGARQTCGGVSGWQACTTAVYTAHNGSYQATMESICDGLDNDCDASIDEALTGALCPNQNGVCAGSRQTCAGTAGWLACGPSTYWLNDASYEPEEMSCDTIDNDCDTAIDEPSWCP